mmetsp:Transcript_76558/g.212652  ORF Transcript_76558/g.212652 Transcript_76558/m.212652 type:complete len:250 (-) Transcript_76558:123-872(-)
MHLSDARDAQRLFVELAESILDVGPQRFLHDVADNSEWHKLAMVRALGKLFAVRERHDAHSRRGHLRHLQEHSLCRQHDLQDQRCEFAMKHLVCLLPLGLGGIAPEIPLRTFVGQENREHSPPEVYLSPTGSATKSRQRDRNHEDANAGKGAPEEREGGHRPRRVWHHIPRGMFGGGNRRLPKQRGNGPRRQAPTSCKHNFAHLRLGRSQLPDGGTVVDDSNMATAAGPTCSTPGRRRAGLQRCVPRRK